MKTRIEIRSYIHFQLSQLGVRNGAHLFEQLCFELARQRHVSNLLPATGPVQSGGDQGRDFESYRTYLTQSSLGDSTFLSLATDEVVVGACTLERGDTAGKIRRDLKSIFAGGERPSRVLYFCEQDVPVASRHKLQAHCRGVYDAVLDIHDGQAIADQLSDPDTFWIASQFLDIPAELYPPEESDDAYAALRSRWLVEKAQASNHADFLEIKEGLRTATREEPLRPDLQGWLAVMRAYLEASVSERFRQKARYEIAVAELRGRGNLDPAQPLVESYFASIDAAGSLPVDLLDAAVLAVFCWGAVQHGHTRVEAQTVLGWALTVSDRVDLALTVVERRGDRCTLLEARAVLAGIPSGDASRDQILDLVLEAWLAVMAAAKDTAFFPVWHIADFVERMAPALSGKPAYRTLRDQIDDLTRIRSGGHAVAEQSQRRGIAHLEAGRRLLAIDELQRAKVGWFSGEAMSNSLRVMTLLSNCYADLGLALAARYYAAGATYLGLHSDDDDVRALTPGAAFQLVRMQAAGGELISSLAMTQQALGLHFALETNPTDFDAHPLLQAVLAEGGIGLAIVRRLAPELVTMTEGLVETWPLAREDRDAVLSLESGHDSAWMTMDEAALMDRLEVELGRSPLEDVGPARTHVWSALGVEWTLTCANDRETVAAAFGLGSVLQVIQVELAHVELLVVPGKVVLDVELGPVVSPRVTTPLDGVANWRVVMPETPPEDDPLGKDEFHEAFSIAATVLGQVTALDARSFKEILTQAMERDLGLRAYSVRPARELMAFAARQVDCFEALAARPASVLPRRIRPREPEELAWPTTTAPGYSPERAREALINRYRRPWETARTSLERALADERVKGLVLGLRDDGLLDWQILGIFWSIICQAQVEAGGRLSMEQLSRAFMDRSRRAERREDAVVDLSIIDAERIEGQRITANAAVLNTWGLRPNRPDLDPEGLRRFLDVRYRQAVDDIPHDDLFGGPRVEVTPPA